MIKNFTRRQLQEQLGFDAEETKIILEYQKKLPILLEANALNVICTGLEASSIRLYMGCVDKNTRDSLTKQYNEYLYKMQEMDIVYLGMWLNRYQRYEMLNKTFNILYPDAKPLFSNVSISKILENKKKLLEEAKSKTNDSTLPFGLSA